MFLHVQTTVGSVRINGGECTVAATVETLQKTPRVMLGGPNIDFELTMPAAEIDQAYDRAVEEGRRVFEVFNSKQVS